ncbi:MAG: YihY family inner membrane protein [Proteobacteria bacterium]|nr:YihY family inner membrane protein [Pseudomonadota bacterium]MCL2307775.1 YihY family inner membrane protein [Pseudomonadota bacterium]
MPDFSLLRRYRIFGFTRFLSQRMLELRMTQAAASLTFATLLALVPLLTVALIVLSAFPVFGEFADRFKLLALGMLVPEYADRVGDYVEEFLRNVGNLTAAGVILLGIAAFLLLHTIESAFNDIWATRNRRSLMQQCLVYWMILTLGPLLIGAGFTLWRWLHHHFGVSDGWPLLAYLFHFLSTWGTTTALLWLVYRVVPNRHVPWRHALIGAAFAALLVEGGRYAFSYYVGKVTSYQLVYGAFASLPIFLLWLYCLWLVVLAGAIIAASLSYWRGAAWRRPCDFRRRFQDAVEILLQLYEAQHEGRALQLTHLRRHINAGDDQIVLLLDTLTHKNMIHRGRDGWVLQRCAETLRLDEVMRLFLDEHPSEPEDLVEIELQGLLHPVFERLNISLDELAQRVKARKAQTS